MNVLKSRWDDSQPIILSESELIPEVFIDMSIYQDDMVEEDQQNEKIQQDYAVYLLDKIEQLEELWAVILKRKNNYKQLGLLRQLTHKMVISGANFVFEEIIKNAQQLELLFDMVLMEGERTLVKRKEKIDALIDNMRLHPLITTEKQLRKMNIKMI
ncbi:MAG: hypothetical protein MUF15_27910 [Acidobacteria bacterium]|nr:hypothetical protein [Acidobacteriota bacterium]